MKQHDVKEVNLYYVTVSTDKTSARGIVKPGTSQQEYISKRMSKLLSDEPNMKLVGYLTIENITKARLERIEHEIKDDMVEAGFLHLGNDHFSFKFNRTGKRSKQYDFVANAILYRAIMYCQRYHHKFTVTLVD